MLTIRQFIHQLSQLDQNLPVLLRWDTFLPTSLVADSGAPPGWKHQPALSQTTALKPEDVAPVWDSLTNTVALEISGRHFAPFVSDYTNAQEIALPLASHVSKAVGLRASGQDQSNPKFV